MLETQDVHAWSYKFHTQEIVLDDNIQRQMAMLMLAMLLKVLASSGRQQGQQQRSKTRRGDMRIHVRMIPKYR